jgi:hypothetical protein
MLWYILLFSNVQPNLIDGLQGTTTPFAESSAQTTSPSNMFPFRPTTDTHDAGVLNAFPSPHPTEDVVYVSRSVGMQDRLQWQPNDVLIGKFSNGHDVGKLMY